MVSAKKSSPRLDSDLVSADVEPPTDTGKRITPIGDALSSLADELAARPAPLPAPSRRRPFAPTHVITVAGEPPTVLHVRPDHDGKGGLHYYDADGWNSATPSGWSHDGKDLRLAGELAPKGSSIARIGATALPSPAKPAPKPAAAAAGARKR